MGWLQKRKRSVLGKETVPDQTGEAAKEKLDEAAELEREAAYIKEELAAAKLEVITGKERRINWRHFFDVLLRK